MRAAHRLARIRRDCRAGGVRVLRAGGAPGGIDSALRSVVLGAVALLATAPNGGCETPVKGPEGSSVAGQRLLAAPVLADAATSYREMRYQEAFDKARAVGRSAASPVREQAAWIAGLSAFQLDQLTEAELQFMTVERSKDALLAADAKIMMGDIRVKQNRMADAAALFRSAAQSLVGDERTRVLGYAEVAEAQVGGGGRTVGAPGTASTGAPVGSSAAPRAFTLQAGAFGSEANARKRANEVSGPLRAAGIGEPRVVRTRDSTGRELFAVQAGTFDSRSSAEAARSRVSSLGVVVSPVG